MQDLYLFQKQSILQSIKWNKILHTVLQFEKEQSNKIKNILWNSATELKKKISNQWFLSMITVERIQTRKDLLVK